MKIIVDVGALRRGYEDDGVRMRRSAIVFVAIVGLLVVTAALVWTAMRSHGPALGTTQYAAPSSAKAISARSASPPDDGNWTMPGKDYASTRFSGLRQLTPQNVGDLQVAFTFSTGTTEGFEAPPLVVN
jgi:glucose dehydrogenase